MCRNVAGRLFLLTFSLSIFILIILSTSSIGLSQEVFRIRPDDGDLPHFVQLPLALQMYGFSSEGNVIRSLEMEVGGGGGDWGEGQGCLRVEWTDEEDAKVNPGTMTVLFSEGNCTNAEENWIKSVGWPSAPVGKKGNLFISPWLSVSAKKTKKMKEKTTKEKSELKVSQGFRLTQTLHLPLPHPPSNVTLLKAENLYWIRISEKTMEEEGQCFSIADTSNDIVLQERDSVLVRFKKKRPGNGKGNQTQEKEEEKREIGKGKENKENGKDLIKEEKGRKMEKEEKSKETEKEGNYKEMNNEVKINEIETEKRVKGNGKEEKVKGKIKKQKENRVKVMVQAQMLGDYGFCNGSEESDWTSVELVVEEEGEEEEELVGIEVKYIQGRNASLYINNSLILSLDAHNYTWDDLSSEGPRWQKGDYINNSLCYHPWFVLTEFVPSSHLNQSELEFVFNCDPRKAKIISPEPFFNQTAQKEKEETEEGKQEDTEEKEEETEQKEEAEGKQEQTGERTEEETKEKEETEEEEETAAVEKEEDYTSFYKLLLVMHSLTLVFIVETAFLTSGWVRDVWRTTKDQRREEFALETAKTIFTFVLTLLLMVMGVVAIGITIALINGY